MCVKCTLFLFHCVIVSVFTPTLFLQVIIFFLRKFGRCLFIVSRACYVYRGNCALTNQMRSFCQCARSLFYCRLLYYLGLGGGLCASPPHCHAAARASSLPSNHIGAGGARFAAMGKCQKIILYFRGRWGVDKENDTAHIA